MGATYKLKRKLADGTLEDVVLQGVGGGESSFVVTITLNGDTYEADYTFDEIYNKIQDGQTVVARYGSSVYQLTFANRGNIGNTEYGGIVFSHFSLTEAGSQGELPNVWVERFEFSYSGVISYSTRTINIPLDYSSIYLTTVNSVDYDGDMLMWDSIAEFYDENGSTVKETPLTLNLPLLAGDGIEFTPNSAGDRMVISATNAGGGSSSGGVAQLQQSVTHAELKALRDNGELVAGMQYRITDFVTTTSQPDTQSAGHPFDIIVTALSNTMLSENASADYHKVADVGGATFDPSVLADEDGNLDDGAVVSHYYVFEDFTVGAEDTVEDYKATDEFVAYDYLENGDGVVVPVIYKTDAEGAIDAPEEFGSPDYADIFYYDGTMEVDGVTYDKWRKICETQDNGLFWDGRTGKIWALTNVIVNSGSVVDPYFANSKLPAWEIKYCLDNDKTRFAWAKKGDYWVYTDFEDKTYILDEKVTVGGQEYFTTTNEMILSIVAEPKTVQELYCYDGREAITFEADGSNIYGWGEDNGGKGVIYYMKDEWDNECPYDFKNIQFKRSADWFAEHGDWGENVLGYTPTEDKWFYTFTWVDENDEPQDSTLIGNSLLNDEGKINGVCGNKIGICSEYQIYFGENSVEALSYNVFVSSYYYESGNFYGCYSNTFSSNCDHNTFGNECNNNTFGNECYSNTFSNLCYSNTFGNECYSNTFSNDCNYNTFGNGCSKNTLFEYAFCNIFENGVVFVDLTSTTQGNDGNRLQYITVSQGVVGSASTRKTINATRNLAYKTTYVAQGSVTTEV